MRGFTLVESLVALSLMAGVLLSTAALLAWGERRLAAGRRSSIAMAAANSVTESLQSEPYHHLYTALGGASHGRLLQVDSRRDAAAARWSPLVGELPDGFVTVRVEALPGGDSFLASRGLRVTVQVGWRGGRRQREVRLCTVRQ
ncbi:hypothetical protein ABI59_01440 [Acidobacteria bacterium Mor1]|nr:hypothetical protein ABI59_01440 [Acidobacteria bacterium Mor1]